MSYEKAFEALRDGDFKTAADLLEQAARDTGYSSDIVNHACTLALYRAGEKNRLADASFRIGESLVDSDPASAMDYFQRAFLGELEASRVRYIGGVFERWAGPRPEAPVSLPIQKVVHIVGSWSKSSREASYVFLLCRSLREQGVESLVMTTESAASWFTNPSGEALSKDFDSDVPGVIAAVEGDFYERADRVAAGVRSSGAQAAFYHAGLNQQITARVAAFRPAPIQVHVEHRGAEMDADLFDGRIRLSRGTIADVRHTVPSIWIPPATDIEERLHGNPRNTRTQMGLESSATVSATFGDLRNASSSGYLHALGELLKRFPKHFHLFSGLGDVKPIRAYLHAEGILPRVRFLGPMSDVAPVMDAVDVYLASFPHTDDAALLEAMGAGKPSVAMRYPQGSPFGASADLLGVSELIASGEGAYIEIAQRLIRDAEARDKFSVSVASRFQKEFHPALLAPRYVKFLEEILAAR